MNVSRVAELVSIGVIFAGGFIWVGSVQADASSTKVRVDKVEAKADALPAQVAVLQTQMTAVQETQKKQDEKLDRILDEVRRR